MDAMNYTRNLKEPLLLPYPNNTCSPIATVYPAYRSLHDTPPTYFPLLFRIVLVTCYMIIVRPGDFDKVYIAEWRITRTWSSIDAADKQSQRRQSG